MFKSFESPLYKHSQVMLFFLYFYLKDTPAGLFQEIRLNQKLNQENDISKQDKNFFG